MALADEDPLEADALLARVVADSTDAKIRRAAMHDLFYLRLKHNRFAEAFMVARSGTMKKKFQSILAPALNITEKNSERLVHLLRAVCSHDISVLKLQSFLDSKQAPAAAYDFSLRVLKKCKIKDVTGILPVPDETAPLDTRTINLTLLALREALEESRLEDAEKISSDLRERGADFLEKNRALAGQLYLLEGRAAAKKKDFPALDASCQTIAADAKFKKARQGCLFLRAYGLLLQNKFTEADELLSRQKVGPLQADMRLLKLAAAVAAGKAPAEKLRQFMRRASYAEVAPMLRDLAAALLKEINANK